jgi:transcriptional regulator with GAF, ATPase, and Fis domain
MSEALERQRAASEVLRVISTSAGQLDPVFQTILANATRICGANFGILNLHENGSWPAAAMHDVPQAFIELRRREPMLHFGPEHPLERVAATKRALHIADVRTTAGYKAGDPAHLTIVELAGARTALVVPMCKEGNLIGAITIYRQEVRPFSEKHIELVTNFAAQAVIAIENARLLNELRQRTTNLIERTADLTEALEQQTATSEVLQVISGSPGDVEPVFSTMLEKAVRICDASFGNIYRWDGKALNLVATHNTPPAFAEARGRSTLRPGSNSLIGACWRRKPSCTSPMLLQLKPTNDGFPRPLKPLN